MLKICAMAPARPDKSTSLARVIERFPDHWGQIRRLAGIDERFNDLCRDYAEAVGLCRFWRERLESQALKRARDYACFVAELEAEISREITTRERRTAPR
jgi:hypothetical protein